MMHEIHEGKGTVLFDNCPRCDEHVKAGLVGLDTTSLRHLADLATNWDNVSERASRIEMRAAKKLQTMRRIVDQAYYTT